MELYLDPARRHDFVLLFDVVNGNPNGDPDAGNMPRLDPETNHGFVTDVALKRKIRDYAALVHGKEIYIQSKTALNTLYEQAMTALDIEPALVDVSDEALLEWLEGDAAALFDVREVEGNKKKVKFEGDFKKQGDILDKIKESEIEIPQELDKKVKKLASDLAKAGGAKSLSGKQREDIKEFMVSKYYDMRMFGAVLTAGTNAGQVKGPVQLTFARSVSPVLPLDISITRVAITREADRERKQTEMGRKPIVPYGLYRAHGFYNPKLAEKLSSSGNPVTTGDLELLWEALRNMFDYDRSAARGEMSCRGLYIFSHKDEKGLGNAPAHRLFELVEVVAGDAAVPPRSFGDYTVKIGGGTLTGDVDRLSIGRDGHRLVILPAGGGAESIAELKIFM
ncbi:MAG: type I-C CRISPR-associated protein Cas7/Csd2 [Peptococcaceae bacterium]|nr:type I-C CRISPR-associated protein Cas7/Csd2 [Peptococcaceae bacterium]